MSEFDVPTGEELPPAAGGRVPAPHRQRAGRSSVAACAALGLVVLAAAGCGRSSQEAVIDRQTFLDTYVDLRTTALAAPGQVLSPADRERVLRQHGVTDQDLLEFVDVRGADPDYMVRLWTDVAGRVPLGQLPPSAGGGVDTAALERPR